MCIAALIPYAMCIAALIPYHVYCCVCVCSGRPLSISQDDVGINGWAVECRVYAEVCEGVRCVVVWGVSGVESVMGEVGREG